MISNFSDWARGRRIVGYGAGELVDRAISGHSLNVEYFVDDLLAGSSKLGRPVYSLAHLKQENGAVAIVIFSRFVGIALLELARFGYRWGNDVTDGRYFGYGAPYFDYYEVLGDSSSVFESRSLQVYLGPDAILNVENIVIPKNAHYSPIRIHVGAGGRCDLRNIQICGGNTISIGKGGRFSVGELTSIGVNCKFGASAMSEIVIGDSVLISGGSTIDAATGSSIMIGKGSTFGEYLQMYSYAPISVGSDCMFSGYVYVEGGAGHDLTIDGIRKMPRAISLGDHVWVGMSATLLSGARIGSNSMVGAKSVVNHEVASNSLVLGNPARTVKKGITWDRDFSAYKAIFHPD
jgi:acetyltransferase-like isoleucine patch superfamily enzyme